MTELPLVEELKIGASDLVRQGEQFFPSHAEHAAATLEGRLDLPASSRHWSPALWSIVYGERSQAGRYVMALTDAPRDTSIWHTGTGQWSGLTASELNQLIAFNVACVAIAGHKPLLRMPLDLIAHRLKPDSAEPCVRFVSLAFRALTHPDWCAPWLSYGVAETPLEAGSDWDPADFDPEDFGGHHLTVNPFSWLRNVHPTIAALSLPPGPAVFVASQDFMPGDWDPADFATSPATPSTGWGAMHQAFMVPRVLSSFWRDRASGDLCLVLANWTEAPAYWQGLLVPWRAPSWGGSFDPRDFLAGDFLTCPYYRVDRLDSGVGDWAPGDWSPADFGGAPSVTEIATGLVGRTRFVCADTSGAQQGENLFLGQVPAYSFQAYRIRQE